MFAEERPYWLLLILGRWHGSLPRSVAYSLGFTYDHNGNRLTQTSGGQPYQSFTYDGHDKLLSGNNNGEVYGYDANGNQTGLSYYGSSYAFTFDDEDRLTNVTRPNGLNDTFAYNGLGQRVAKTDSTGTYALVSDGASPAADVLADGAAVYTPGLSSRKGSSSEFRHGDLLRSLRFLTDANQNVVANRLFSAFGSTVASSGDPSTPFGWVGDGESQTDADTGLVLMGHRLYDDRIGRFLSEDPLGDGDNWYAYADNDPVDNTDPSGLSDSFVDPSKFGMAMGDGPSAWGEFHDGDPGTYDFFSWNQQAGKDTYDHSVTIGPSYLDMMMQSTSGPMMGAGPSGMGGGFMAHSSGIRPSTEEDHQRGISRLKRDQGGEKGDLRREQAIRDRNAKKGGQSTRDPDGSIKRAREAANAERRAALEAEERAAAEEAATAAEELEAAEILVDVDEAAIVIGTIVK